VGRIVGNGGDIAHGAMSEALWLNVVGCVRIESWVRINRVCLFFLASIRRCFSAYSPLGDFINRDFRAY
jgi:hypothetical protein